MSKKSGKKRQADEVELLLRSYRKKIADLELLRVKRDKLQSDLRRIPDEVSYTNNTSLLKFEPPNYKISRMVENAGIKSAEIHKDLQSALNITIIEIECMERETKIIEVLINSLDDQEQFVVKKIYISGLQWYHMPGEYYKEFNQHNSIDTLKRKRQSAFVKIRKLMEKI